MRQLPLYLLSFLAIFSLGACKKPAFVGSGTIVTEERAIDAVERISFRLSGKLILHQAEVASLRITADDNILPLLEEVVNEGTLILRVKENHAFKVKSPIVYELSLPNPNGLSLAGSGELVIEPLNVPTLNIALIGSGTISGVDIRATALSSSIVGEGKLTLAGEVLSHNVSIVNRNGRGTARYEAGQLKSSHVSLVVDGMAEVGVCGLEHLTYTITPQTTLRYYGTPQLSPQNDLKLTPQPLGPC